MPKWVFDKPLPPIAVDSQKRASQESAMSIAGANNLSNVLEGINKQAVGNT